LLPAKVVVPAARCWFQSGSGPYTVEAAISAVKMPVLGAIEPARPNTA
jgi:hypothetical protein